MNTPRLRLVIALGLFFATGLTAPAGAQDLFLRGAHLVDPATQTVTVGNLLILDGVIAGRPDQPP